MTLTQFLHDSFTSYHAAQNGAAMLRQAGFVPLGDKKQTTAAGVYRVEGGCLLACKKGGDTLQLALSHTDSPALRVTWQKGAPVAQLLPTEKYGGGLLRSYFDRPLKIAGRVVVRKNGALIYKNVCSDFTVVVPSLAVHLGGGAAGEELSVSRDLKPLLGECDDLFAALGEKDAVDGDLFCVPADAPFYSGTHGEYLCAPRIDDLVSVYAQVHALIDADNKATCAIACFDSEETGSQTREGAEGKLLHAFLAEMLGDKTDKLLQNALALSCDAAHALHPAHPEKYSGNAPILGGGVAIKRNDRYATDALAAAATVEVFAKAGVKTQTYYHHADLRCGSTIGLTAAHGLGCRVCDLGVPQLAMHAAVETAARSDIEGLQAGVTAFFASKTIVSDDGIRIE